MRMSQPRVHASVDLMTGSGPKLTGRGKGVNWGGMGTDRRWKEERAVGVLVFEGVSWREEAWLGASWRI